MVTTFDVIRDTIFSHLIIRVPGIQSVTLDTIKFNV